MKILFLAPVQGKLQLKDVYEHINNKLIQLGHNVFSDVFINIDPSELTDKSKKFNFEKIHQTTFTEIKKADVCIFEASFQRLSLGFFLNAALELQKPVVIIYQRGHEFGLLKTLEKNEKVVLFEYKDLGEIDDEIASLLEYAAENQDSRFNFFISPEQLAYIDNLSKSSKIPKSVFLRKLIEEDMSLNGEYQLT